MPFTLEMLPLVLSSGEDCSFSAIGALDNFFFLLILLFFRFFRLHLFLLNLFLLDAFQQFQCAELLALKALVFFIDDDSHQHFHNHLIELFAGLVDFTVFIGFNVVSSHQLRALHLLIFHLVNFQLQQSLFQLLLNLLLESQPDLHLSAGNLVAFLKQLDAVKSLLLGRLVQFQRKVDILDGQLDVVRGKAAFGDRVHALLHNNLDDIRQDAACLCVTLLVTHLQLSTFQNNLNDVSLGLAREELVEVCLLGQNAMGGVLVNLLDLEDFGEVFLQTVAPVDCLVAVAGDLEVLVVDLVADGGHVGHAHLGDWLLQHYSFINYRNQNRQNQPTDRYGLMKQQRFLEAKSLSKCSKQRL